MSTVFIDKNALLELIKLEALMLPALAIYLQVIQNNIERYSKENVKTDGIPVLTEDKYKEAMAGAEMSLIVLSASLVSLIIALPLMKSEHADVALNLGWGLLIVAVLLFILSILASLGVFESMEQKRDKILEKFKTLQKALKEF